MAALKRQMVAVLFTDIIDGNHPGSAWLCNAPIYNRFISVI